MKLTRLRCPNCGADFENVDLEQGQRIFTCTRLGCGATFIVDQGEKFADIDKREADKIEQYRIEMNSALSPFDRYLAMRYAENIIAILPNDFRAKAVLSIAQSTDSNKRPLYNFLSSGSDCTTEEFEEIFPIILKHCDYRGLKLLEDSIQSITDSQTKSKMQVQINRQIAYLKKKNDDYADVPRDVFVCHSCDDVDIAMNVVKILEEDGNKCWISERNMPPDSRYYWEKIEKSIQHCTIFLVLCSNSAMHSDAVQKEIGIAESSKVERLELKLDDAPHTVLFKHFFDGINWIDATKDKSHAINELKEWVYQLKRTKSTDAEKNTVASAKRKNQEDIINLKLEQEKITREKELRQQRIEVEKQRIEEKKIEKEKNKVSKKKKILLAFFVLLPGLGLLSQTVDAFSNKNILRGIVLILPTVCLLTAWLFGRKIIKKKNYLMWPLLIVGYASFYCINVNDTKQVIPAVTVKDNSIVPTIASNITTNESEGIYTYQIRDYVGKNAASIGNLYAGNLTDEYGHGRIKIIFITENGILLESGQDLIKNYVVTAQNIPAGTSLVMVHQRDSRGKPYDTLVDYQNYDEILLYATPIGETPYVPVSIEPLPTLDRHYYHIRDYVGKNAASFGEKYSDYRVDQYGYGRLRINFISDDGSFVDKNDIKSLSTFVVVSQDIPVNSILEVVYDKDSKGIEYDTLVQSMNYEEINLYVTKIDDKLATTYETLPTVMPTSVQTETDTDIETGKALPTLTPTLYQTETYTPTLTAVSSSTPIPTSSNTTSTSNNNNYQTPVKPVIINQENGNYTITEFGYSIHFGRNFQYSIIIHNNVSDRVVENPTFRIVARDAEGKVIGFEEKDLHRIYPGQDEYYANQAFSIEEIPATVEVQVTGANDESKLKDPNLVAHPEFIPIEFSGVSIQGTYFLGELYNPNDYHINKIIICALYRDNNNDLIDGQCGVAENVDAKQTVPFKISGGRSKDFSSYEIHGQLWRLD